ncbi:hypothetical protein BU15DRAFT_86685 [Melanogaster broomeanus]|nr:hypothetical protein BU15DRAFT_86685 [Melanogaster broomeanus]
MPPAHTPGISRSVRLVVGSSRTDHHTWRHRLQRVQANWTPLLSTLVESFLNFQRGQRPSSPPSNAEEEASYDFTIPCINIYTVATEVTISRSATVSNPVEALVLNGYLSSTPHSPTIAVSFSTLELYHRLRLRKPSFSVEAFAKVICDIYKFPYRRRYHTVLADTFDIYLTIRRQVDTQVKEALGRNSTEWRVQNACPACCYELNDEPELHYSRLFAFDGNNSLSCMALLGDREVGDQRVFKSDYFLDAEYVNKFADEVQERHTVAEADAEVSLPLSSCVEHWKAAAADAKKKSWGIFEETGVFASACRHGMILWIVDMVRSGELFKYPLAIVNKALEVLGPRLLIGYDIGCKLSVMVGSSSLRSKFEDSESRRCVDAFHGYSHSYACQDKNHSNVIIGAGLKDFGVMERIFSSSNQLAAWDEDRYLNLSIMLYRHYTQALKIIKTETVAIDKAKRSLGVTDEDIRQWRTEQSDYLKMSSGEAEWNVHAVAYVELLQKLRAARSTVETSGSAFISATPTNYEFISPSFTPNTSMSYYTNLSQTRKLETAHRQAAERYDELLREVIALELKMGIVRRWDVFDRQYMETIKYISRQKYRRALNNLQRLLNLSQSGYKMQMHIAKSLQTRCKAIQTALKIYNEAAVEIGQPTLDWSKVSHYAFLEEFTLLEESAQDIRGQRWTEPAVRELMKQSLRVEHAHEEIIRCNVELCRLHTAIIDEEQEFTSVLTQLSTVGDPIHGAVAEFCERRRRIHAHVLARVLAVYELDGFSGNPGVGVQKGSMANEKVDDTNGLVEEC